MTDLQPHAHTDERFRCKLTVAYGDLTAVESALEQLMADEPGVTLHEDAPFNVAAASTMWETLVISASGGGLMALGPVLVALIRKNRVTITFKDRTGREFTYEGPAPDDETLRRLSDGIGDAGERDASGPAQLPTRAGHVEPGDGNS